ncbi:MAG: hypothetical protein M1820_002681 [Bogoriella megaspora]|nr:MAG: hypothetical protein M1820_002681 [Bogoriella megaspora]
MELSRSEYPAILENLQPSQAVDTLNTRVKHVSRLNTEIADWLKERRRVEEAYAHGLKRLSRLTPPDESSELGVFTGPWQGIISATETLSESHATLAQRIEEDVERPLREFQNSNREIQGLSTIQGNLTSMAKEVENAQKKSDKLNAQGQKASAAKVANAAQEVDSARSSWHSQAPFVFEKLQQVDESRLNHLRDVLTQFQTHEVDHVERIRQSTESCLNGILSIETADEIKTWALRATRGLPRMERRYSRPTTGGSLVPTASNIPPVPRLPSDAVAPTLSNIVNDDASSKSGSLQEQRTPSRLKGLKRLGTVLGRNKRASMMPLGHDSQSPDRKEKAKSPFSSFTGRGRSREKSSSLEPPQEEPSSSLGRSALQEEDSLPPRSRGNEPTSPGVEHDTNGINGAAGSSQNQSSFSDEMNQAIRNSLQDPLQTSKPGNTEKDAEGFSVPPSATDPIAQAQQEAAASGEAAGPQFKVDIRNAPIQEEGADAALANVASTLRASTFPTRKAGTLRGRRDRNSMIIPESPVTDFSRLGVGDTNEQTSTSLPTTPRLVPPERTSTEPTKPASPSEDFEPPPGPPPSFGSPADTAQAFGPPSFSTPIDTVQAFEPPPGPPPSHQAKDSTVSAESTPLTASRSSIAPNNVPLSPPKVGHRAGMLSEDHAASDAASVRSARSALSSHSTTIKHPDLHSPGLNSSIVETVSAWFEQGSITKAAVIGELALAYNSTDITSTPGQDTIRLEHFSILEKVAPNLAFVSQIPDKSGEYTVALSNISKTQVAFKYQVHLDESSLGTHAPLLLNPAWKCEPTQTSVILSYSLNPAFLEHAGSETKSVTLSNVVLVIHLEPAAKPTSCQSKPVGTFSRDKGLIYWRLGDVTLTADGAPQKLLARFITENEAKPGFVEGRWEITSGGDGKELKDSAEGAFGSGLSVTRFEAAGAAKDGAEEDDPFADEGAGGSATPKGSWKEVGGVRRLVSGTYQTS